MIDVTFNVLELLLHLLPNTNRKEMVRGVKTQECLSLFLKKIEVGHFLNLFLNICFVGLLSLKEATPF